MLELLRDGDAAELEELVHAHLRTARHVLEAGPVPAVGIDRGGREHGRRRIA
jgi:hypothetical protein